MKVFFTASFRGKAKYQKYYDLIVKVIESNNVELISPEKGNYKSLLTKEDIRLAKTERQLHYTAIKKGIQWADIVIIEISQEDFQLGHEGTLATQNKKPVLCLSLTENFSEKIINRYFFGAKYNEYNVRWIINEFIRKHQKNLLSERFNFFLSPSQMNLLEKKATNAAMNTSEYLRGLIEKD